MDDEIEGTVKNGEINSFFSEFTLSLNFTREKYRATATTNIRLKKYIQVFVRFRKNKKENSFKIDISV